jgi:hypothetical protein
MEAEVDAALCQLMDTVTGAVGSVLASLTQETVVAFDEDYETIDAISFGAPCQPPPSSAQEGAVYQALMPLCKELINSLEGTATLEEVESIKVLLSSMSVEAKRNAEARLRSNSRKRKAGRFVSCMPENNTRHKTHGTQHYDCST